MVKDPKDTSEVTTKEMTTTPPPPPAQPYGDPNDPNAVQPSQKTQEEIAAGQAALDAGPKFERPRVLDPANADPALAAEVADAMNRENEAEDLEEPEDWVPPGEPLPGEVPSRGIPAGGLLPGEVPPQGTPDRRQPDPRVQSAPKGADPAAARARFYEEEYDEGADREKTKELVKESAKNREQAREQKAKK